MYLDRCVTYVPGLYPVAAPRSDLPAGKPPAGELGRSMRASVKAALRAR